MPACRSRSAANSLSGPPAATTATRAQMYAAHGASPASRKSIASPT
ncbi:MAG: hypothetical protein ACJ79L_14940 [Anaeromyxobacteraceae bacterium]